MHIYIVASLYKTLPTRWLAQIKEMQDSRSVAFSQYAPLRRAIVAELERPGEGSTVLEHSLSLRRPTAAQNKVMAKSRQALKDFRRLFRADLGDLHENFMASAYSQFPVEWKGFKLTGGFHFSVMPKQNEIKYVYVHAASWPDEKTEAFIELLRIVGKSRYSAKQSQVVFLDLSKNEIRSPKKSSSRIQGELQKTLELLAQFERVFSGEEEISE